MSFLAFSKSDFSNNSIIKFLWFLNYLNSVNEIETIAITLFVMLVRRGNTLNIDFWKKNLLPESGKLSKVKIDKRFNCQIKLHSESFLHFYEILKLE